MRIGFIGLGRMGQRMALNLVRAGADPLVFDINSSALDTLVREGARAAPSILGVARMSDVVFTSLPGPAEVEAVVLGEQGLLASMGRGTTLFDLSTSSPRLARRLEELFRQRGAFMLDAPVSGGPSGAASGNLVLWVGGDRGAFNRHLDILRMFSHPHYVGGIGAGAVTKLAHNMLGYMLLLAQAEIFSLACKGGVDPLDLWEALRFGVVGKQSPLDMLVNQFLPGEYETPAFAMRLAHKDVKLATALARELEVPMRLANLTLEEITEALGRGFGEWDSRAYLQLQLQRAGVKIAVPRDRIKAAQQRAAARQTGRR